MKKKPLLATLLLALGVVGCQDDTVGVEGPTGDLPTDGAAVVRILLTDAPSDYIASAEVDIGRVELVPKDDGEHVVLSEDGTDGFVNLLDFQNAATTPIAEAAIDPGTFVQLRLVVEAARVSLIDGYEFRDGSTEKDLKVPSGAQTGIKLNLSTEGEEDAGVTIVPGETVLVLDFDVNRSFVLRGNPETPAGVHGVIFTPTIRVTAQDVAASISGTVTSAEDGLGVPGLVVTAEPTDEGIVEGYQTKAGTAITDEDGNYTIHFLVPGSYEVTVDVPAGFVTDPESQAVDLEFSEDETGVDFTVEDVRGSIEGTVTASTELPDAVVEGLTVTAMPEAEGMDPLEATTDADGNYLFTEVVPGTYTVTVEVGEDEVTDPAENVVEVGQNEEVTDVDFEIVEDVSGSIAGTVSTELAEVSVAGLEVSAIPDVEGAEPVTTETDAEGKYVLDGLAPGTYTVTVVVGEGLATQPESQQVILGENAEETEIDFAVVTSGS